ncbi:MAG: hypothetical protein WB662_11785 [Methyloceanibacter sp.]
MKLGGGDLFAHADSLSEAASTSRSFEQGKHGWGYRDDASNRSNDASTRSYCGEDKYRASDPSIRRAIALSGCA